MKTLNNIKKAISYLKYEGIIKTQKDIALKMNVNKSNVSSALSGDKRYLTDNFIIKFCKTFPIISLDFILKDKGEMLTTNHLNEPSSEYQVKTERITEDNYKNKKRVPYYDIDFTAGVVSSFSDINESPAFYVDYQPFNDCTAYINTFGDSMYPKYKNGERLAVKKIENFNVIIWGETYLVVTNSNANDLRVVKDVHYHDDESKIILRSSNPQYKGDTVIDKKDIISMFAVKGKISQNFI